MVDLQIIVVLDLCAQKLCGLSENFTLRIKNMVVEQTILSRELSSDFCDSTKDIVVDQISVVRQNFFGFTSNMLYLTRNG